VPGRNSSVEEKREAGAKTCEKIQPSDRKGDHGRDPERKESSPTREKLGDDPKKTLCPSAVERLGKRAEKRVLLRVNQKKATLGKQTLMPASTLGRHVKERSKKRLAKTSASKTCGKKK